MAETNASFPCFPWRVLRSPGKCGVIRRPAVFSQGSRADSLLHVAIDPPAHQDQIADLEQLMFQELTLSILLGPGQRHA